MIQNFIEMLEYYKLLLVEAAPDRGKVMDLLNRAFYDLKTDDDIAALRTWFTEACLCDQ